MVVKELTDLGSGVTVLSERPIPVADLLTRFASLPKPPTGGQIIVLADVTTDLAVSWPDAVAQVGGAARGFEIEVRLMGEFHPPDVRTVREDHVILFTPLSQNERLWSREDALAWAKISGLELADPRRVFAGVSQHMEGIRKHLFAPVIASPLGKMVFSQHQFLGVGLPLDGSPKVTIFPGMFDGVAICYHFYIPQLRPDSSL